MTPTRRRRIVLSAAVAALATVAAAAMLTLATVRSLREFPDDPLGAGDFVIRPQVLARDGTPLSFTLENRWNRDVVPLSAFPMLLQHAFIAAEDQHFYEHHGVDWPARFAAVWQNLRAFSGVRGAGTITEQVVRMIHPRPRTVWSHWMEGFEAARLERRVSKAQILAFYLNQVPYADRRRGVVQAARLYFDRGLDTLSPAEQLSLAVLVRSPQGMDLRRNRPRAQRAIDPLADRLMQHGYLTAAQREQVRADPLQLRSPAEVLDAGHFVSYVLDRSMSSGQMPPARIRTTLDPHFQLLTQRILDSGLSAIAKRRVHDGAVLVIDTERNEIEAWVVGSAHATVDSAPAPIGYDSVMTPRQPGSTMKPLLYAMALERGWTAATLIDDSELSESVGGGQHTFHNYSHVHYGPLRLRETLGNSLNIPAVRTLKFVGQDRFLDRLHALGITSLIQHADFYGDGLALGNGEVSLYEMAQAYTALARQGDYLPIAYLADEAGNRPAGGRSGVRVFSPEVATLIGNILSDPDARMREFGAGLQFPVETAIKTGTSTDYRDAWAIAFDYRHTVAVWMGNLDGTAMDGVTGAVGPAMIVRSVFSELNRNQETRDLPLSRQLVSAKICRRDGRPADEACASSDEWFIPGTVPVQSAVADRADGDRAGAGPAGAGPAPPPAVTYRLIQPTAGLHVARDPRIPKEFEALPIQIAPIPGLSAVAWYVDGREVSRTTVDHYAWPLSPGAHEVYSRIWDGQSPEAHSTDVIRFYVH